MNRLSFESDSTKLKVSVRIHEAVFLYFISTIAIIMDDIQYFKQPTPGLFHSGLNGSLELKNREESSAGK